jgi:diguanylate cyclase (GGDEF)-like protein/excisionase family DNA binding protein
MTAGIRDLPRDLRRRIAAAIRDRESGLAADLAAALAQGPELTPAAWRECAGTLIGLIALAIEEGGLDSRQGGILKLCPFAPPLRVRQIVQALSRAERVSLEELALHDRLGATSEPWPAVSYAVRAAILEILAAFSEREESQSGLRDPLTTLLSRNAVDLALAQEIQRAIRHRHGVALILFDIDDLTALNASHGYGAGDRLLERLGILARQFFRTHDWVARYGGDSLAVLLPEATLDQAATLATRFREMVQQRLVLVDHKTDVVTSVTVSAAAVGTDLVKVELEPAYVMSEAAAAVVRAKMNGGNRVERVALLPTSVTIIGAATLLGISTRDVVGLLRRGTLKATRRGRHLHIDRAAIEERKHHGGV